MAIARRVATAPARERANPFSRPRAIGRPAGRGNSIPAMSFSLFLSRYTRILPLTLRVQERASETHVVSQGKPVPVSRAGRVSVRRRRRSRAHDCYFSALVSATPCKHTRVPVHPAVPPRKKPAGDELRGPRTLRRRTHAVGILLAAEIGHDAAVGAVGARRAIDSEPRYVDQHRVARADHHFRSRKRQTAESERTRANSPALALRLVNTEGAVVARVNFCALRCPSFSALFAETRRDDAQPKDVENACVPYAIASARGSIARSPRTSEHVRT